jgi:hypothetical protein
MKRLAWITFCLALAAMVGSLAWLGLRLAEAPPAPPDIASHTEGATQQRPSALANPEPMSQPVLTPRSEAHAATPAPVETAPALTVEELQKALDTDAAKPHEALLTFRSALALAEFQQRAARAGLKVIAADPKLRAARVGYQDIAALHREITGNASDYESAGPNYLARIPGLPPPAPQTDPANAGGHAEFRSHGFEAIGATGDRSNWGRDAVVAVLDSGITAHQTFREGQVTHFDLVGDGEPFDGHGTAMASLIAGSAQGAEGVSPRTRLLDFRVAGPDGYSDTATLSSAIVKAADMGAHIINISLGAFGTSPMLEAAVQYALAKNILVVAAAGNEQMDQLAIPAALPGVIAVGAVDASGTQAYFSNAGDNLAFLAPGVGIISGYSDGRIVIGRGTSQATAITTGIIAKLVSDGYQRTSIPRLLRQSAQRVSGTPQQVGAGSVRIPR